MLIGPNFKPFYEDRSRQGSGHEDVGRASSGRSAAAPVWGWISYDPELDLVYYGTANPGPWNPDMRPGDNKWTCTIFARRPDTGEAIWAYQIFPHDDHDYDGVNENMLLDLNIKGRLRKVLAHPDRDGRMYIIDRATGEVISAEPFAFQNTTEGVDLKTGRIKVVDAKKTGFKTTRDMCPAPPGGKGLAAVGFLAQDRTCMYIPHNNLCYRDAGRAGELHRGHAVCRREREDVCRARAAIAASSRAWDPVNAKAVWKVKEEFPAWSGAVVTAGDVVFYGTMDGWFKALDAHNGNLLWQFKVGSGIIGQPITLQRSGRQAVRRGACRASADGAARSCPAA